MALNILKAEVIEILVAKFHNKCVGVALTFFLFYILSTFKKKIKMYITSTYLRGLL